MSTLSLPEKIMLESAAAWEPTYCEPTSGWKDQYTLVWRAEAFHGKIGTYIKSKSKPTPAKIRAALKRELLRRFKSSLRCDAKRVAYSWLQKNAKAIPVETTHAAKMAQDALYDLDLKIHAELFSSDGPRLLMASTHGWILGELAEIRCLVSHLASAVDRSSN